LPKSATASCRPAAGIILVAGLLAYGGSLSGPFVFDDVTAITENPSIRRLWPPGPLFFPPPGTTAAGRPVLNLSLAVNYAASGTRVWSYHALNLAIHVAAALTLFGIVRRTPFGRPSRTSSAGLALAAALLWELHPLQTESVTYVVQRAESLMGLFYLLTLYCFIRGADRQFEAGGAPGRGRGGHAWMGLAVLACLCGMATKEVMVSAPVIVFLYDRTFLAPSFAQAWRRRWPTHLALAATWLLLASLIVRGGARGGSVGFGTGVAWRDYVLTQCPAIWHYLTLCFWPHPLVFDYGFHLIRDPRIVVPAAGAVLALGVATIVGLVRWPACGLAGCWFFAILAPTSLVPGSSQVMAEHRMYLALAPVIVLALFGLRRLGRTAFIGVSAVLAVACAGLTARRNADYRSALSLWSDTVAKVPDNPWAREGLADALAQGGRDNEALTDYRAAVRLRPDYPEGHYNLGVELAKLARGPDAISEFRQAIGLKPGFPAAEYNLGLALAQAGRLDEAAAHFQNTLALRPDFPGAHLNLGSVWWQLGRAAPAAEQLRAAVAEDPGSAQARTEFGMALAASGRLDGAISLFRTVVELQPDLAAAHENLAIALRQAGLAAEAELQLAQARRLRLPP
jgi:tetratricopeptide (TPR) repeat protein